MLHELHKSKIIQYSQEANSFFGIAKRHISTVPFKCLFVYLPVLGRNF